MGTFTFRCQVALNMILFSRLLCDIASIYLFLGLLEIHNTQVFFRHHMVIYDGGGE